MIDKILTILDTNNNDEKYAVIAQMVEWSKAFNRKDPKLDIQSFIKCNFGNFKHSPRNYLIMR